MEEYHRLYQRTGLVLSGAETPTIPLDEMLSQLKNNDRQNLNALTVLLFQYAKYLMISSSYDCTMPANLQGIWNGSYTPPWECKYTININTEMNYWMAEPCGLSECHEPLFRLIERLSENGKETARRLYGAKGFCAHHNTDLWVIRVRTEFLTPPPSGLWEAHGCRFIYTSIFFLHRMKYFWQSGRYR